MQKELAKRGLGYRTAVKELDLPVKFSFLGMVARGDLRPDFNLAVALERELEIPVEHWPHLREPVTELLRLRGAA